MRAGRGGVLVVSGDPGMGKSRLLIELRALAERDGIRWLEGRCVSYGESLPYSPFRDLLRGEWIGAGFPATEISPSSCESAPKSVRAVSVRPDPSSPARPTISPGQIPTETSRRSGSRRKPRAASAGGALVSAFVVSARRCASSSASSRPSILATSS